MLLGEHEHTLDDKNRLTLPARLREQLGERVVVTAGFDGCLVAYAHDEWERQVARIRELDTLSRESRMMQRYVFASAVVGDLDRQGRVVLPASLLESAGIEREVTVAGMYDHLEIWDRAKWRDHRRELEGSAEHVAERIANRD
ncbi:MAG: division/cell wall cluster transcriptional repressor MraZ [Actinobacteria bacterium]|nr:division/cell wall cluster transcriptional repressor MraZ [Actinomycetota bacterium]MBV8597883.1 division/cell wall cluster transcriptional repressor MraZ [Actinomycetota bacterium]